MFCITAESCRRFPLAEILIMAAMNVEAIPDSAPRYLAAQQTLAVERCARPNAGAALSS